MDYTQIISFKKQEMNANGWNELDVSVEELLELSQDDNLNDIVEGLKKNMLEGDSVVQGDINQPDNTLIVRYYCDNLSPSRNHIY